MTTTTTTTQKRKKHCAGEPALAPAPFLTKTYQMVDEGGSKDMISWGEKGTSFVVWKPVEFARDLLPVHFKHNNFSSFVRQLNTYGFHKVVPDRWEFANENFRRGDQRLLSSIRRRKPVPSPHVSPGVVAKASSNDAGNNNQPLPSSLSHSGDVHSSCSASSPQPSLMPQPRPLPRRLLELLNENEILRKDNEVLNTELVQARCHFQDLFAFLSKLVDVGKLNLGHLMHQVMASGAQRNVGVTETKNEGSGKENKEAIHKEQGLKLFGVLLKEIEGEGIDNNSRMKKRARFCDEVGGNDGCVERPIKIGLGLPWMGLQTAAHCAAGWH